MQRSILVLCVSLLTSSPSPVRGQAAAAEGGTVAARIDSVVSARSTADAFSGVVLVANKTGIVYQRAVGVADRERASAMRLDTKLQIASVTKLFTQIAVRQLEQSGKLALTDTVGKFLPEYPNAIVRSRVTVEQLLRHRSGVGSFWNERFMARRSQVRTVRDYLELFQNDSLLFEPGTSEAYSNGGYVVLGAIIERVSGQSYHDYVREHVFGPAGMAQTLPDDHRLLLPNAAIGYTSMSSGPVAGDTRLAGSGPRPGYSAPSAPSAAGQPAAAGGAPRADSAGASGGMRLRLRDANGRELSPEAAREAMARRAASAGPRRPNAEFHASLSSPAGDHFSTVGDFLKLAQALTSHRLLDSTHTAALLGTRYASGTDFRANGGGPGVNAEFSIYPSGDVIVVLANYDPPSATDIAQFIRSLISPR